MEIINNVDVVKNITLYIKHLSFIAFLIAGIVLYPILIEYQMGKLCLIIFLVYTIITFITIFIKNEIETYNVVNNIVVCALHIYTCFIAYKYYLVSDVVFINNAEYFNLNFLMLAICILVLTVNKIILSNCK